MDWTGDLCLSFEVKVNVRHNHMCFTEDNSCCATSAEVIINFPFSLQCNQQVVIKHDGR